MTVKSASIDNSRGEYSKVQIYTTPQINLLLNLIQVKVYNVNSGTLSGLLEGEYFSGKVIMANNQHSNSVFNVPLNNSALYSIEAVVLSEIDPELIQDIHIVPLR